MNEIMTMTMFALFAINLLMAIDSPPPGLIVSGKGADLTVTFDFASGSKINQDQLNWIKQQGVISFLDLAFSEVTDDQVTSILDRVDVRGLRLSHNNLTRMNLESLAHEENIETIEIQRCGIRADDLHALLPCKKLKDLRIGGVKAEASIDEATLREIKSLRTLVVIAKSISSDELSKLSRVTQLTELHLFLVEGNPNIFSTLSRAMPKTRVLISLKNDGPFGWE